MRNVISIIMAGGLAMLWGCAGGGTASERATPATRPAMLSTSEVNLARTSLASVSASSVTGMRRLDDLFYGVTNAFDDGGNWFNGTNHTYWLSDGNDREPWIEIKFKRPVRISAISADCEMPFRAVLWDGYGERFETPWEPHAIGLRKPLEDVWRIVLHFPKPQRRSVRVDEVRVLGTSKALMQMDIVPRLEPRQDFGSGTYY